MIALVARGKSLIAPDGARIARCASREAADLLALYASTSAALHDPVAYRLHLVRIATLEKALLQTDPFPAPKTA